MDNISSNNKILKAKNVKRYTEFGDFNVKTDRKKEKLKDRIKRKNSN